MPADDIAQALAEASARLDRSGLRSSGGESLPGPALDTLCARTHPARTHPEAEILLGFVLGKSRAQLRTHLDLPLGAHAAALFRSLIARRLAGEPIAYLVGRREFWSLDLLVGPDTLIPRPESEHLVEVVLEYTDPKEAARIADIGTGAGPVALAIAFERPQAQVLATDRSPAALGVARKNAKRLGIDNVSFALADSCTALKEERWSMIVSNPPYIAQDDPHLLSGDLAFEPSQALVAGPQGLDMLARLAREAPARLVGGGRLVLEHGGQQGAEVRRLLADAGLSQIETGRDLAGHERITSGCRRI